MIDLVFLNGIQYRLHQPSILVMFEIPLLQHTTNTCRNPWDGGKMYGEPLYSNNKSHSCQILEQSEYLKLSK